MSAKKPAGLLAHPALHKLFGTGGRQPMDFDESRSDKADPGHKPYRVGIDARIETPCCSCCDERNDGKPEHQGDQSGKGA